MSGLTCHLFEAKQCVSQPALCMGSKSSIFLTFPACFFLKACIIQPCELSRCDPIIPVRCHQAISFLHLFSDCSAFFRFLWDFLPHSLGFQILRGQCCFLELPFSHSCPSLSAHLSFSSALLLSLSSSKWECQRHFSFSFALVWLQCRSWILQLPFSLLLL